MSLKFNLLLQKPYFHKHLIKALEKIYQIILLFFFSLKFVTCKVLNIRLNYMRTTNSRAIRSCMAECDCLATPREILPPQVVSQSFQHLPEVFLTVVQLQKSL